MTGKPEARQARPAIRRLLPDLRAAPMRAFAWFSGTLAAAILVLFVVDLQDRHRGTLEKARESAANYAAVLAEHTARTFEAVDRTLAEVAEVRDEARSGRLADRFLRAA